MVFLSILSQLQLEKARSEEERAKEAFNSFPVAALGRSRRLGAGGGGPLLSILSQLQQRIGKRHRRVLQEAAFNSFPVAAGQLTEEQHRALARLSILSQLQPERVTQRRSQQLLEPFNSFPVAAQSAIQAGSHAGPLP